MLLSLVGIVSAIAALLAIVVSALVIGLCLLIAWTTDALRGDRGYPPRGAHGGGGDRSRALPAASHRKRDSASRTAGR